MKHLITKSIEYSEVLERWIENIQDAIPESIKESIEWKDLLVAALLTRREPDREQARYELAVGWMWEVLAHLQGMANDLSFGNEWAKMLDRKTAGTAAGAAEAADAAIYVAARAATDHDAARVAAIYASNYAEDDPVADAAKAEAAASRAISRVARRIASAADDAAIAQAARYGYIDAYTAYAAYAVFHASVAYVDYHRDVNKDYFWAEVVQPAAILKRMIEA